MQTQTPATTPQETPHRFTDALSQLSGRASGPGDRSGGLDQLVSAASMAYNLYSELDYITSTRITHKTEPDVYAILERARNDAYDAWQLIERQGLPLLQRWQRETLGYSESEISR